MYKILHVKSFVNCPVHNWKVTVFFKVFARVLDEVEKITRSKTWQWRQVVGKVTGEKHFVLPSVITSGLSVSDILFVVIPRIPVWLLSLAFMLRVTLFPERSVSVARVQTLRGDTFSFFILTHLYAYTYFITDIN